MGMHTFGERINGERARVLALSALFTLLPATGPFAQALPTLKVVTLPSDTGAQGFYAQDKGFFKRAGLNVQITTMNPALIGASVASGTFDIGETDVPSVAAARQHGQDFVMIVPSAVFNSKLKASTGILVAGNSAIKSGRDLNGKIVAVSGLKNIGQVSVQAWIDKNGGDSSTVKFIQMPFSTMIPALEQGRVDAAQFSEPVLDEALAAGLRLLSVQPMYSAIANEFTISVWFCTNEFALAHPDIVRKYASVMAEAARWANTHQAESGQILTQWTKLPVSSTMPRVSYGEMLVASEIQPVVDVAAKYDAIHSSMRAKDMFAPMVPSR
jgi:NitT/TauT family transport system substrate-binding protein